ncbi:hypothetical protein B0H14DRAFT_3496022 [Mycena olivaceomarginata]|nr:hypothetical protein B0H14DRAFT_3496022 [Mycena olivaceomarginata]
MNVSSGHPAAERANADFLNPATMPDWASHKKSDNLSTTNISSGHPIAERANTDFLNPATMPDWASHKKSVWNGEFFAESLAVKSSQYL